MRRVRSLAGLLARDALVSALVAAIAFGPAALPALAGPSGEETERGEVDIQHAAGSADWFIHASDGSIIRYDSFDIAVGEAVQFIQTRNGELNNDARVLNRILVGGPTQIHGSLTGNGHIYIVNPAGVFFHEGATVNANGIHAAGGHLSDTDFTENPATSVDHYTGVIGDVRNAADIVARAVSLVGAEVVNSGSIDASDVILEDGWIVIAAGNDVIIGREPTAQGGRGLLIRVEGAAGAVFNAGKTGVSNTGTLDAGADGTVRMGAGDLYGTAIFSSNAIRAREIALAAGNRGDIALAGVVDAEKVDISFRGGTTVGELRGTTVGAAVTVRADELKLTAAGTGAEIRVSDEVAFRSQADAAVGPNKVTLEQAATLSSSRLTTIDIGANTAGTTRDLALGSTGGNVVVESDDKDVVAGSKLALTGTLADIRGTDPLNVASLAVSGATATAGGSARSEGDIVATAGDIYVQGNLQLVTKPSNAGDPPVSTLVSAHQGTVDVDGNVSTSAGGGLRIEARDVLLGTTNDANEPVGGAITSRGDVTIGFVDADGLEQTQTVFARAIDTRGASGAEGGNLDVAASGNITLGAITTNGGAGSSTSQPNRDGGSVSVRSTGADARVVVGAITTGGASAAERGAIELEAEAGTVVLSGALNATGGQIANADHARDRGVRVAANQIRLDANALTIAGSNVDLDGAIRGADIVPATDPATTRSVDLGITASGATNVRSTAELLSLSIASTGQSVVLGGDIDAETTVKIGFDGSGPATISNGGAPVSVRANRVELAASDSSEVDGRDARVDLGEGIHFDLSAIPASEGVAAKAATLLLDQDGAIDSAAASRLATAGQLTTDLTLELRTNDAVTLDADARTAVAGTDLVIASRSFAATGSPTGTASDLNLSSLVLSTRDALDVDFGVTADSVTLEGAAAGTGDLTLRSALQANKIKLVAGDGPSGSGDDSKVVFETGGSLRSQASASTLPTRVDLIQDAAIDSADLPDVDTVFGGSVAGLAYGLQSTDSSVTLSAGASEELAGSALELRGRTGVNLGNEALSLASLTAETPAGLVVSQRIDATASDGVIRLHAGSDGAGDLEINAPLAANTIELVAGSGNHTDATARIQLQNGATFSGAPGEVRPDRFAFEQDAEIGVSASSTAVPSLALFGGDIAGMTYSLRSMGADLRIDDTATVNGTQLALEGDTGIDINGDLSVSGLDLTGATALSGNVVSTGNVLVRSQLTLDGTGNQSVSAGAGDLTASGAITKSGAGKVTLSGQNVDVRAVTTGHAGDSLEIIGVNSVKAGALDASGAIGAAGGNVTVGVDPDATSGEVLITSITTRGGNGPVSATDPATAPEAGRDGGIVHVTGKAIAIGNVNSSGGNASAIATSDDELTLDGGNGRSITLVADQVTLNGSLDARGGAGAAKDPTAVAEHKGATADVSVLGSILLGSIATSGGTNVIRGNNVLVEGGVSRAATLEPGQAAFSVFAEDSLRLGGNLSAGRIELELANGDLDLASGGVSEISADTIRLAATDGNGGNQDREVILTGLTLEDEAGGPAPKSLTIEQDFSIGGEGSPLPQMGGVNRTIALISHDGRIEIDGASVVGSGTNLTLAANGVANPTGPAVHVTGDLVVAGLSIGNGSLVDGDAQIDGNLSVGVLSSSATRLDVGGAASISGNATFGGTGDQTLSVGDGQTLALGGATTAKTSAGKLTLDADSIQLTSVGDQTIENKAGQLEVGSLGGTGLVKGNFDEAGNPVPGTDPAGLTLRGSAEAGTGPAITVHGTRTQDFDGDPIADGRDYAIAVADGNLTIDARALPTGSTTPVEPATWSVDGDVLGRGDVDLVGRGVLTGGRESYVISAERAALTSLSRGGELRIAGIASADGDVVLSAQGDEPTDAIPNPSALILRGEFDLTHDLTLSGTTEIAGDTVLSVDGDVVVESDVRGKGGLSIASDRVLFASIAETQSVQAGSLSFGSNDGAPPPALPSVFRNGDLQLSATNGDVQFAAGQQLIVAGDLDVSSNAAIVLADTAALTIDLNAPTIQARGGSDVVANRISLSNRPSSLGGSATFATPTREQISGDIAGADVLLRQIANDPVELTQANLAAGIFPDVNGPAFFDYATQVPHIGRPAAIVRPRADVARLAEVREARPLWADELLFYLDARSRRAPSAREQGALPPVSAGPNATTPDTALETVDPAVEQAIAPYRALFRPTTEVDPETGIVQGEDRAPEIRAAFAHAVQVAAAGRGGATPTAAEVAAAIERDPKLAEARAYRADLGELVAAANRALDVDQRARFRELLLARVAPQDISPAEFNALIP